MNRRRGILAAALAACTFAAGCGGGGDDADHAAASAAHRVRVTYADASTPIERSVRGAKVADSVAREINEHVQLPHDVTIAMGAEGDSPHFDYETRTVIVPWAFVNDVEAQLARRGYDDTRLERGVDEVVAFVLTHEVAHVLIDVLDLPIAGKEEDAADNFAAIIAVDYERNDGIISATTDFLQALAETERNDSAAYFDEHSLSLQRIYAINCLMYGSDPKRFADLSSRTGIPDAQLGRCTAEWINTTRSWYRIIKPHLASRD